MAHLSIGPGGSFLSPSSEGASLTRLFVLIDYRPTSDESYTLKIDLPSDWGPPNIAHMVLTQMLKMRERVEIRDVHGEAWPFERAMIRAFWMAPRS